MVNQSNLQKASELLRAIAHPVRLAIIKYIAENNTTNVNNIYNTLKLEQSITSQHLRILRVTNLVITQRDGKFIHYSINYALVKQLNKSLDNFFSKKLEISFEDETAGVVLNGHKAIASKNQSSKSVAR